MRTAEECHNIGTMEKGHDDDGTRELISMLTVLSPGKSQNMLKDPKILPLRELGSLFSDSPLPSFEF